MTREDAIANPTDNVPECQKAQSDAVQSPQYLVDLAKDSEGGNILLGRRLAVMVWRLFTLGSGLMAGYFGRLAFCVCSATASVLLVELDARAQVAMPQKDEWKMHDGTVVRGKAYAFGRQLCFLQRRNGKLLMNGQKIDDPASNALLKKLCDEQGVPVDDPKRLQEILSKQRFAQAVLPFFTLRYHDQTGRDSEVPTILLAPEEIQELRPVFEAWMQEKQKEHEEQVRKAQELANQQALLVMQAEALRAQQDMARAAQRSADANKKAADELERLRRKSK